MKIAINTLALYKTKVGMGKYIMELVNRVPKDDLENTYLIYVSEENKPFFNISERNVSIKKVSKIWTHPFLKIFWEQLFLPISLWKNNVNIYHAPGFVLPLFKSENIKYVVTVADMTFFSHPQYHMAKKNFYFQQLIPYSLQKAEKIIVISESTRNDIIKITKINPAKIQTIHLGVDDIFEKKKKAACQHIQGKYGIKHPYILFVGMLEPRKNIEGLIKAFSSAERKGYRLVIVGKKGWMYESIFALIKKLNIEEEIIFTGYVPDEELPYLYSAATCFVYPSFYEGFGIPVIEAMACGCPVITSRNSSLQEIAGAAAILIDPYNVGSIKKAIESCVMDKGYCEKMVQRGFVQAKKFQWASMAKETRALYTSIETKRTERE